MRCSSLLILIVPLLALSTNVQAQLEEPAFAEYQQRIGAPPSVVEDSATTLAEKNRYLRGIAEPQADRLPMVLVPGDLLLRFDGVPFTLYLRSTNHHTKAVLKSQKLGLSEKTRRKARHFLQQVASRLGTKNG